VLVIADVAARGVAQRELSDRVHGRVPEARRVDAAISSFPFMGRLLLNGNVSEVRLAAIGIRVAGGLDVDTIVVDAHDVSIDRDQLLGHRRVVLTGVGRGDVTVMVSGKAISSALGIPVQLSRAGVSVVYRGQTLPATVGFRAGAIVVDIGRVASLRVPMPKIPLVPCQPSATVTGDRVVLTCSFDRVPPEMIGVANAVSS
jgi:LmeA-like phospholipid-binding